MSWSEVSVSDGCSLHVWTCRGLRTGPTVLIAAGVHGDEYEGPAAVLELSRRLGLDQIAGTVYAIPVTNPLAFAAGTRTTPQDALNLARVFPGNPNGSITERLADVVFNRFAAEANYLIDLHSGGIEYVFKPLAGFYGEPQPGNASYEAALRFGLPILWQLPRTPGVLSHEASKRGTVAIGHEYLGAGQLSSTGVNSYVDGVLSCLRYWNVLEDGGQPNQPGGDVYLGDWQLSPCDGLCVNRRKIGDQVIREQVVSEIWSMSGSFTPIMAESEGMLLGLRSKGFIRAGNWAVFIGRKL